MIKNRGAIFLLAFRWILLLLAALMFEKMADALCIKISGKGFFDTLKIVLPIGALPSELSLGDINKDFFVGLLQFISGLLLCSRYFICLIDPIWRSVGINKKTEFNDGLWLKYLENVKVTTTIKVAFVSIIQFLFFYESALAIPNVNQWLFFLLLMIVFDIFAFLLYPFLKSIPHFLVIVFALLLLISFLLIHTIFVLFLRLFEFAWPNLRKFIEKDVKVDNVILAFIHRIRDKAKTNVFIIWEAYGLFDFLDLLSVLVTLCYFNYNKNELLTCTLFAVLTVGISIWNIRSKHIIYKIHINVLTLVKV